MSISNLIKKWLKYGKKKRDGSPVVKREKPFIVSCCLYVQVSTNIKETSMKWRRSEILQARSTIQALSKIYVLPIIKRMRPSLFMAGERRPAISLKSPLKLQQKSSGLFQTGSIFLERRGSTRTILVHLIEIILLSTKPLQRHCNT